MKEILTALKKSIEEKKDAVLVTVVGSTGSTPRGEGARMLMSADGHLAGTVGGGMVEKKSEDIALEVLNKKETFIQKFILAPNDVADIGMICGGDVAILFQFIDHQNQDMLKLCQEGLEHIATHRQCWLISIADNQYANNLGFYSEDTGVIGVPEDLFTKDDFRRGLYAEQKGETDIYFESLISAGKVYIFGGGHVAQALVPVLKSIDFYCVVCEDRPEFLTKELFPNADETVFGDLSKLSNLITMKPDDYALVMTRGHKFDFEIERQLIELDLFYVGVIGSKRKVATHTKMLRDEGYSLEKIKTFHMPIGLEIAAETPAEIAISIAAEMIMIRAGE